MRLTTGPKRAESAFRAVAGLPSALECSLIVGGGDPGSPAAGIGQADEVVGLLPADGRAGARHAAGLPAELGGERPEPAGQPPPSGQRPPGLLTVQVAARAGADQRTYRCITRSEGVRLPDLQCPSHPGDLGRTESLPTNAMGKVIRMDLADRLRTSAPL